MNERKFNLVLMSASIRTGRKSHKVATMFSEIIADNPFYSMLSIDLKDFVFQPLQDKYYDIDPLESSLEQLAKNINEADGIVIVSPEYKAGIPGNLKNVLDLLPPQILQHKIAAVVSTSSGGFGGINCLVQLRPVLMALGALCIPEKLCISYVDQLFDDDNKDKVSKTKSKLEHFITEFTWYAKLLLAKERIELQ